MFWLIVLSIYIAVYMCKLTWVDNYSTYVIILFFMEAPIIIPLIILPRLMKIIPILKKYIANDGWAILPIFAVFTYPIGLFAIITWTVMIVI